MLQDTYSGMDSIPPKQPMRSWLVIYFHKVLILYPETSWIGGGVYHYSTLINLIMLYIAGKAKVLLATVP